MELHPSWTIIYLKISIFAYNLVIKKGFPCPLLSQRMKVTSADKNPKLTPNLKRNLINPNTEPSPQELKNLHPKVHVFIIEKLMDKWDHMQTPTLLLPDTQTCTPTSPGTFSPNRSSWTTTPPSITCHSCTRSKTADLLFFASNSPILLKLAKVNVDFFYQSFFISRDWSNGQEK